MLLNNNPMPQKYVKDELYKKFLLTKSIRQKVAAEKRAERAKAIITESKAMTINTKTMIDETNEMIANGEAMIANGLAMIAETIAMSV
jgi:hypothetical protein